MEKNINCNLIERNNKDSILISYRTSADISRACNTGNETFIRTVIHFALVKGASLGALISIEEGYKIHRKTQKISGEEIYQMVFQQLCIFQSYAAEYNTSIHHFQLNGALRERACKEPYIALCIAKSVLDFDDKIMICGTNDSQLVKQAKKLHIKTIPEL